MIALNEFVLRFLGESVIDPNDGGPATKENFDDSCGDLMKQFAKPAGPEVGKGPNVNTSAKDTNASGVRWATAFKKGTPMSQEKGDGTPPPNTVDGPSKDNPNTFITK